MRRRQHDHLALRVDLFGHLVALLLRVAEQLAEHPLDVVVRVVVAVPEKHVVARHLALLALGLFLRLGHHRVRLFVLGDDGFVCVHAAT